MNLLLLEESDFIAPDRVRITGRRHKQLYEVIHAESSQRQGVLRPLRRQSAPAEKYPQEVR